MRDDRELLRRLREEQANLVASAAKSGSLPPDRIISRIADLELTIAALEFMIRTAAKQRQL